MITWNNKITTTKIKYFINSKIDDNPWVAKVFEIKQKIPIGAITITKERIFIITLLNSKKNFFIIEVSFMTDRALPIRMAKNITCNISPLTSDSNGLLGIIFSNISRKEGGSEIFICCDSNFKSNPFPGSIKLANSNEIVIAKKVVTK